MARSVPLTVSRALARRRVAWGTIAIYLFLSLCAIAMVAPFYWMITSAFKDNAEIVAYPPHWIPERPTLENLIKVWTQVNFGRYFLNSLFVATTITAISVFTSSLVGYVLAKYDFWGRDVIFTGILATMMIPWPVLLIPS
jgi:ABC-type glycerol-3-phosphate transport system permease component